MVLEKASYSVFKGFEERDICDLFTLKGEKNAETLQSAFKVMQNLYNADPESINNLGSVVNQFKLYGLLIKPTHFISHKTRIVPAWLYEQYGLYCYITCAYETGMARPDMVVTVEGWLADNGYDSVMGVRDFGGDGEKVFVIGVKENGICKLSRMPDGCCGFSRFILKDGIVHTL